MLHASICLLWMVQALLGISSVKSHLYEAPANTLARFGEQVVLKCHQASLNITWTFCSKASGSHVIAVNCKLLAFAVEDYKLSETSHECNLHINSFQSKHIGTYTCQDLSLGHLGYTAELGNKDENLARNKGTAQSTTQNNLRSGYGVDGSLNTWPHTDKNPQEWWSVDLEQVTAVGRVRITNLNLESQCLRNFIIGLTNERFWNSKPDLSKSSVCKYFTGFPPGGIPINIYCEPNTTPGRFFFILMTLADHIHFKELEVYYN